VAGSTGVDPEPRWIGVNECIKRQYNIAAEYDKCQELFRCLLATGEGDIGRLIDQIKLIDESTQLKTISILFSKINTMLGNLTPAKASVAVKGIRESRIFPINKPGAASGSCTMVTSMKSDIWFFADRPYLYDSFCGKVPLLAFSAEKLNEMHILLDAMECKPRFLSALVDSQTSPSGEVYLQEKYTKSFRAKVPFIIS
jgi:hypothetical protein